MGDVPLTLPFEISLNASNSPAGYLDLLVCDHVDVDDDADPGSNVKTVWPHFGADGFSAVAQECCAGLTHPFDASVVPKA